MLQCDVVDLIAHNGAYLDERFLRLKQTNVIKLVRKDVRQRARGLKKEQKELREGKIDSKPRRSGLRLKKECEEGFSVRRRSRRKCGCP